MIQVVQITTVGDANVLKVSNIPKPILSNSKQVLIDMDYIGVNYIDCYMRSGLYPHSLPFILGREGAGTIREIFSSNNPKGKEQITNPSNDSDYKLSVGDRVAFFGAPSYGQTLAVPIDRIIKLPMEIETKDAASILLQGMTALGLTSVAYKVKKNDWILIPAAAGGTGLLLVQICKFLQARVIGIVSNETKAKIALNHGSDHVIIYTKESIIDRAREITKLNGQEGVDVVFDGVGKATLESSLSSLKPTGTMVSFGSTSGPIVKEPTLSQLGLRKWVTFSLGNITKTHKELLELASRLFSMFKNGNLKTNIHKIYPLESANQAHQDLESGTTIGKLLLTPKKIQK